MKIIQMGRPLVGKARTLQMLADLEQSGEGRGTHYLWGYITGWISNGDKEIEARFDAVYAKATTKETFKI